MDPNQYISQMEDAYCNWFMDNPNTKMKYPLEPDDHPKLDMSPFLDEDDTQIYQSLIWAMQWAITIGRKNINVAVMTLSSFCVQPCSGHLMRVKWMYWYLIKFCHYKIKFHIDERNYNNVPIVKHNWSNTPYGDGK